MNFNIDNFKFPTGVFFELISKETPFKEIYKEQINLIKLPASYLKFSEKRKDEFLLGRLCVYLAAKKNNINATDVDINENRSPRWPVGIIGSISHNNSYVVAIVACSSQYKAISLDLEGVGRISDDLFIRQIATEKDLQVLKNLRKINEHEYKAICFSSKESLFKLLNPLVDKFFGFNDAYISNINEDDNEFEITLTVELDETYGPKGVSRFIGKYYLSAGNCLTFMSIKKI